MTPILIVEDELIIARDIQRLLIGFGYEPVEIATSAPEAVSLASRLRPALVLMDIHLASDSDGIEAAHAIRTRFGIPSVFLTAYASDDVIERAKSADPLGYVIKPFDEQGLRTTVEIALHKSQTEQALRASEARYRAVVESAHDAIVTCDRSGLVVGWSRAAAAQFGYAEAEVIGQPITLLMPERDRAQRHEELRLAAEPGQLSFFDSVHELTVRHKDGSERPAELSVSRWETADGWFITGMLRDISGRKRAEASLRLQSAALNAAANAIVITDQNGIIEWVNPAFSRMTGYTRDEAVGRNPRELVKSGVHGPAFYAEMWATLTAGAVWEGEVTNRRKDGALYIEHQTITPLKSAEGAITHFIGVKRDMTEQKQLQAQVQQAQKMEVVGRLAGGVAHDFNNLLTVINGTADLALLDLPAQHPLRAEFEHIQEAGNRAALLTRQLLAFSRKQVLAPAAVNLSAHVEGTSRMLRRLIGEDVTLALRAATDLADVFVDPGQLEQVLLNLAVNARDAMPQGGTLTIETRNLELDSAFAIYRGGLPPGPYVALTVSDTGMGMTAEARNRVFEPFFTTKEQGKGTGLGLATVYGVVRQSGGTILVESELGRGTCFTIILPAHEAGATRQAVTRPVSTTARGNETIVLAEDEGALRSVAARMLREAGYRVIEASDGGSALAKVTNHGGPVHAVVTDVVMPDMSGPQLATALTAARPGIKVLLTSGYTDDAMVHHGVATDTVHFLAKPYTAGALTTKLRQLLDAEPTAG